MIHCALYIIYNLVYIAHSKNKYVPVQFKMYCKEYSISRYSMYCEDFVNTSMAQNILHPYSTVNVL